MKNLSVHELQAMASQVVRAAEKGETFEISRYSKPVAVVIGKREYEKLFGECRQCIAQLREKLGIKISQRKK